MGDEFSNTGSGNWWGASLRNRFDQSGGGGGGGGGEAVPSSSSSSCSSSGLSCGTLGGFGWVATESEAVEIKDRSTTSIDSGGSVVFHDKLQDSSSAADHHHHLQMMGLGLSSQPVDQWSQSLLRSGDKAETSFRVMLGDNINQQEQPSTLSTTQMFWPRDRSFFLDHHQSQFSPHGGGGSSNDTTVSLPANANLIQIDNTNSNNIFQAFLGSDQQQNQPQHSSLSYNHQFGAAAGNFGLGSNSDQMAVAAAASPSTWLRPVPQTFLRTSPPPPKPHSSPLRFNNNAPFWNPSAAAAAAVSSHDHVPSNFYPTLQTQQQIHQTPNFDKKQKNMSEIRDSRSTAKRSGSDQPVAKRTKSETQSPSPAFKVRKEKMGDRIAALQQLVSPFGKTDAASVLSEAIEYIKFLHEQVTALSNPYMKSGASLQHHQQKLDQSNDPEAPRQDLRSRGLCLVPVSSTFPVTHETTVDFWTPTFGGTFR